MTIRSERPKTRSHPVLEEAARELELAGRRRVEAVMKRLAPIATKLGPALAQAGAPEPQAIDAVVRLASVSRMAARACEPWVLKHKDGILRALAVADGTSPGRLAEELPELLGIPHQLWSHGWLLGGHVGAHRRARRETGGVT